MKQVNTVAIKLRIEPSVYEELQVLAQSIGFRSAQAYIRYWAKNITNAHGDLALSKPEQQALRYIELLFLDSNKSFNNTDMALSYAISQIQLRKVASMMRNVGMDSSRLI